MLTTLSILSLDQGKLNRRPTGDEDYFARFQEAAPKPEKRRPWHDLGIAWPWFGKPRSGERI